MSSNNDCGTKQKQNFRIQLGVDRKQYFITKRSAVTKITHALQ